MMRAAMRGWVHTAAAVSLGCLVAAAAGAQTFSADTQLTDGECQDFDRDGKGFLGLKRARDVEVEIISLEFLPSEGGKAPAVAVDYRILNRSKRKVWLRIGVSVESLDLGPEFQQVSQQNCVELRQLDIKDLGKEAGGRPIIGLFGPKPYEAFLREEIEFKPPSGLAMLTLPYEGRYTIELEVAPVKSGKFKQDRKGHNNTDSFSMRYEANLNWRNLRVLSGSQGEEAAVAIDISNSGNRDSGPLRVVGVVDGEPQAPQVQDPIERRGTQTVTYTFDPAKESNVLEIYDDETERLLFTRPVPVPGSADDNGGSGTNDTEGPDYKIERVRAINSDPDGGFYYLQVDVINVGNKPGEVARVNWDDFAANLDGGGTQVGAILRPLQEEVGPLEVGEISSAMAEIDLSVAAPQDRADQAEGSVVIELADDTNPADNTRDYQLDLGGGGIVTGGGGEMEVDAIVYDAVARAPDYAFEAGVLEVDMNLVNYGDELTDITWTVRLQGVDSEGETVFDESSLQPGDFGYATTYWTLPPGMFATDADPIKNISGTVEVTAKDSDGNSLPPASFPIEVEYYDSYPEIDFRVLVCAVDGQPVPDNSIEIADGQTRNFHVVVRNDGELPIHPDDQLQLKTYVGAENGLSQQQTQELDAIGEYPRDITGDCAATSDDEWPEFVTSIVVAPTRPGTFGVSESDMSDNRLELSLRQTGCN